MHRRCIICGQAPGEQSVYPRNMAEARRWQNLANLRTYDVDTESLCQHGCVCALHLDTDQDCCSDPDAVCSLRNSAGKTTGKRKNTSIKWSSSDTGRCQSPIPQCSCTYATDTNTNCGMQMQSNQNLEPMSKESSNGDRSNIELHRCRGAILQGNLYSQMQKNSYPQQPTGSSSGTVPPRKLKASKVAVPKLYAYINVPILQNPNTVPEESTCSLMWSPSPEPAVCNSDCCPKPRYSNSSQRSPNSTQKQSQPEPRPCFTYNQQQLQSDDVYLSSSNATTGRSCSTTCSSHPGRMPEVKNKCVQAYRKCQLKDQGVQSFQDQDVQCSQENLQPEATSAASREPTKTSITAGYDSDKAKSNSSQRSTSLATKYDSVSCKCFSSTGNIDMPNFECVCEEQKCSVNAVNVLLMNGPRHTDYEGPNPEICVQESDLADCNERAVFPDVDKPSYRLCRAATSAPNTKGKQDEANVLVLEEDLMKGCCLEGPCDQGQSQNELQFVEGMNSISQGIPSGQFCDNWINSSGTANFNKVLELQKARINELENLLQQHNKLQETIQARMSELQSQETPAETANKE